MFMCLRQHGNIRVDYFHSVRKAIHRVGDRMEGYLQRGLARNPFFPFSSLAITMPSGEKDTFEEARQYREENSQK